MDLFLLIILIAVVACLVWFHKRLSVVEKTYGYLLKMLDENIDKQQRRKKA